MMQVADPRGRERQLRRDAREVAAVSDPDAYGTTRLERLWRKRRAEASRLRAAHPGLLRWWVVAEAEAAARAVQRRIERRVRMAGQTYSDDDEASYTLVLDKLRKSFPAVTEDHRTVRCADCYAWLLGRGETPGRGLPPVVAVYAPSRVPGHRVPLCEACSRKELP